MSSHTESCRCSLHQQLAQRQLAKIRHSSYRQLALAILGPSAPRGDAALAEAMAEHAKLLRAGNLINLSDRRAA
jgi:hypothetical protein